METASEIVATSTTSIPRAAALRDRLDMAPCASVTGTLSSRVLDVMVTSSPAARRSAHPPLFRLPNPPAPPGRVLALEPHAQEQRVRDHGARTSILDRRSRACGPEPRASGPRVTGTTVGEGVTGSARSVGPAGPVI